MRSLALVALVAGVAVAAPLPPGFTVLPQSISPDGKLGVIAPDVDHLVDKEHQNKLVEIATNKVIATIDAETVFPHENHADITPAWSSDGSLLEWYIGGKWGSFELILIRVDHGAVTQQIDVREAAVKAALANAVKANPKAYAAAKKEGEGNGRWFRDGFAIDVRPADGAPVKLPLKFVVEMTSNPKELDDYPAAARFKASMTGVVGADGKISFGSFVVAK